ncbi:glycosyltransferase family 2 protein [Candidatus Woesearchaeota archaeon]|nr:glycosyltransferase family 2 protein [Candidatus Woesearchaeota archaeon]
MKINNLALVIPAHNEENNLQRIVPAILKELNKYIFEIVIVNDASSDKTREVAEKLKKKYRKLKLVNRTPPCGVGRALKDGFKAVSKNAEWVLTMDCDFLENVKEVKRLIKKADEGYDGVIGSRYIERGRLVNYPPIKRFSNRIYHILVRGVLGIKQVDLTNNFKLYKKEIIDSIEWKSNDFAINAETGIFPILAGYRIAEVPVSWVQRYFDKSDFKVIKLAPSYLKVAFRAIRMKFGGYSSAKY